MRHGEYNLIRKELLRFFFAWRGKKKTVFQPGLTFFFLLKVRNAIRTTEKKRGVFQVHRMYLRETHKGAPNNTIELHKSIIPRFIIRTIV